MNLFEKSIEIIKKNQHPSGAYVACPNFPTYNYCWLRDGSFIANAMDTVHEYGSSEKFFNWVNRVILSQENRVAKIIEKKNKGIEINPLEFLPTRYTLDGKANEDDWPNFQLDGYGTWLWALSQHISLTENLNLINDYTKSINITIDYIINFWDVPNYDCWEENGDKIHTSTLSCLYGGLSSISKYIIDKKILDTAEKIKEFVLRNCTLNNRLEKYIGSKSVDASLLWAAYPFELIKATDEIMVNTVKEIEKTLYHNGGVHRYAKDTYYGGGEWLLLSSWLGIYYIEVGMKDKAYNILNWVESNAKDNGEMPEQVLYHVNNPSYIKYWEDKWGKVASPLLWSHAMYIILKNKLEYIY